MPLRPAVWKRCREFLDADEEIHYLVPATGLWSPSVAGMTPFIIAITDKRVVILACRWLRRDVPRSVWARYPRRVQLGPVGKDPTGAPAFTLGRSLFEIDDEYAAAINAADAEIADGGFLPPDPLPDL